MKNTFCIFVFILFSSIQLYSQINYNSPESAVFDAAYNRYLISNTGNGNVIARSMTGTLSYFNQGGSTSIRGITIFGNRLYAAGDEGILVYDLSNGQKVATYNIAGKIFPNDIVADAAGNVYVSDDPAHKIYKWTAATQTVSTFVTMGVSDNPNGLFYDQANNRLLAVFWTNNSPIKAVDLTSGAVTTVTTTTLSNLDGITRDILGNYYISAWTQGGVYKFNNAFTSGPTLVSSGHSGPADIFYDNQNNVLVIPNMNTNTITFMQMSTGTVVSPNGGENWAVGTTQNIQWTSTNITNVKIEYSTNNGTSWNIIAASTNAAAGTYSWLIPNTPSTNCLVQISDADYPNVKDQSNSTFTISPQASITVTQPNGGEVWQAGSTQNILWSSTGVADVKIEYSTNTGTSWNTIIAQTNAASGTYSWLIPNTTSTNCLVQISNAVNPTTKDQSNSTFTISQPASITVTKPNGGEIWFVGSNQNIQWTSSSVSNVKIEYSTNNGTSWTTIATQLSAAAGSYLWNIPNTPSLNCLVKISDAVNSLINDQSNSIFSIELQPALTVVKPNGGEIWDIGTKQNIQWTSINVAEIKIEYTTNNGSNWIEVVNRVSTSGGIYQWTIPNTPSTNCLVRVSSFADANVKDQSDNVFKIQIPVSVNDENISYEFQLYQNYPNPFNPETVISYQLPAYSFVTLIIYDPLGNEIEKIVNEMQAPGKHNVMWRQKNISSGVYYCRLISNNYSATKKMILLR
jgi:hypothetical protein